MRSLFALFLLGAAGLACPAQSDPAVMNGTLEPELAIVSSDAEIGLVLRVEVPADGKIDRTLLSGMLLHTTVDGKKGPVIGSALSGAIEVAGGTTIVRRLRVPVARVLTAPGGGMTRVAFQWPGLPSASAAVDVVPDASKIDLDALDYSKTKVVLLTSEGSLTLGFLADKAPNHARNFVKLARSGFYDGTKFHRIISDFMIQGGCPNTKAGATGVPGTGGSGETVNAEINDTRHVRGILSAARTSDPNSHSSQFFLCTGDAPWLDGAYTAFGKLTAGDEVLAKLAATPVSLGAGGEMSVPKTPVHLHRAIVLPVLE
jgi:peptidyl-prolyl cis-trans isomerase B (cyclophilin B)